jgi:type I restriction enzyme S subunit
MATNQGFKSFVPQKNQLNPDFLFYWLRAHKPYLESLGNGATFKEVSKAVVSRVEICLPPLTEQRHIADILDRADAIWRKRKEVVALSDELLRSIFFEMFGDPVTNPKGLRRATLGELIEVKSGTFLPAKAMDASGSHAVYGGNGINGRHTEYMFDEPRIVIGRVGVYCGAIHRTEAKSWVTDNALYVSRISGDLSDIYLEHALRMANLNQYASQAAQPLISGARINPAEVLVPSLDVQLAFAAVCEKHAIMTRRQSDAHTIAEDLFSSLVARAFAGRLEPGSTAAEGRL